MTRESQYRIDSDNMVHIPKEDYIGKKTWWGWIVGALLVPTILGLLAAGSFTTRLDANEAAVKEKATQKELISLEKNIEQRFNSLEKSLDRVEKTTTSNHKEILEILKK